MLVPCGMLGTAKIRLAMHTVHRAKCDAQFGTIFRIMLGIGKAWQDNDIVM